MEQNTNPQKSEIQETISNKNTTINNSVNRPNYSSPAHTMPNQMKPKKSNGLRIFFIVIFLILGFVFSIVFFQSFYPNVEILLTNRYMAPLISVFSSMAAACLLLRQKRAILFSYISVWLLPIWLICIYREVHGSLSIQSTGFLSGLVQLINIFFVVLAVVIQTTLVILLRILSTTYDDEKLSAD